MRRNRGVRSGTLRRGGLTRRAGLVGCPDRDRPVVALQEVIDELVAGLLVDQTSRANISAARAPKKPATCSRAALTTSSSPRILVD
jgi:hypothetical protein